MSRRKVPYTSHETQVQFRPLAVYHIFHDTVILYVLKILTKFGVAPQSFSENQNSVQDQDHGFILNFNTRPTFHT